MMRWMSAVAVAVALTLSPAWGEKQKLPITDDLIHDQVIKKLADDPDVRGGAIDVDVHSGVVTLKGKVDTDRRRQRAEKLAKKVKGVTSVENQIVISK